MDVGAVLEQVHKGRNAANQARVRFTTGEPNRAAAVWLAVAGDQGPDAGGAKRPTILVVVVSWVGVDASTPAQKAPWTCADSGNSFDRRQEPGDVVAVRAGQYDGDLRAVRIGGDVAPETWSRAIGEVRSCLWLAPISGTERGIDDDT